MKPQRIAVGIATVGRPEVLINTLSALRRQARPADAIFVCAPGDADVLGVAESAPDVHALTGPRGLPHQRNVILGAAHDFDALAFFDDDFVPCARYLAEIEAAFARHDDVVLITGDVVLDGIIGPGLSFEEGDRAVKASSGAPVKQPAMADVYNAYGCNMAARLSAVKRAGAMFDESLPLYAWLEDVDFSRQLARQGRVVKLAAARGVHLGVKSGRQSGVRLGYSQVANPVYLMRKGTCTLSKGLPQIGRNLLANFSKALWPELYVDRRGRVRGNLQALLDIARGRVTPARALEL